MLHEQLAELELHLASTNTALSNEDEWGLVKKWLMVAAQTDGGQGTTKPKSHITFNTTAIITSDELIHRWMTDRVDAALGLGCIFLPESSGFLYFPFRSPFSHRNLNFRSAVTLFFGTNRSKNLLSKTKASGQTMVCLGYQVVQFCSFCGLKLSNWMWLLH
jgi:hypothetical protein